MARHRAPALLGGVLTGALLLSGCGDSGGEGENASTPSVTVTADPDVPAPSSGEPTDPSDPSPSTDGTPEVVDTIAEDLAAPWGLAFLPGGDAIVTERDSRRVLRISGPQHVVTTIETIEDAAPQGEAGLLGVAVSPTFSRDRLLYFYLSTAEDNRVVRARLGADGLGPVEVVLDAIPNGFIHDGGRLLFGPDGFLYVSTGEGGEPERAQDPDSLGGKILRITADGEPAPGNPSGTAVWSTGHRNVQGLAFDGNRLWASEFGQNTFDELNLIRGGDDYGWPEVEGKGGTDQGFTDPQEVWDTDDASPSGLAYLDGHLWLAALKGERLWRIDVDGDRASDPEGFFVGDYGRMRTVVAAPDGDLWLMTSNTDTRGDPAENDDRILVIRP